MFSRHTGVCLPPTAPLEKEGASINHISHRGRCHLHGYPPLLPGPVLHHQSCVSAALHTQKRASSKQNEVGQGTASLVKEKNHDAKPPDERDHGWLEADNVNKRTIKELPEFVVANPSSVQLDVSRWQSPFHHTRYFLLYWPLSFITFMEFLHLYVPIACSLVSVGWNSGIYG